MKILNRLSASAKSLAVWPSVKRVAERMSWRRAEDFDEAESDKVRESFWRKLRRNLGRLPFAEDLVAAYHAAFDSKTPLAAKAVLVGALTYFIVPTDLVPDILIGPGFLDDATVLAYAIATARKHILPRHYERARHALAQTREEKGDGVHSAWQEAGV
jgi:uncharacterized membrane protein YkvA (DUF1232 family)